jgi:hypothetical protein
MSFDFPLEREDRAKRKEERKGRVGGSTQEKSGNSLYYNL